MGKRKGLSPRTRFEVLKRDGFRCHYCGRGPLDSLLTVDHVVAAANGGTDDPANLVTACAECNGGKSDVPLDHSRLRRGPAPEALLEQAEQIGAYLEACQRLEEARQEFRQFVAEKWMAALHLKTMPESFVTTLVRVAKDHGIGQLDEAIDIVVGKNLHGDSAMRYFCGVIRKRAANDG